MTNTVICSLHFDKNQFNHNSTRALLSPGAVPHALVLETPPCSPLPCVNRKRPTDHAVKRVDGHKLKKRRLNFDEENKAISSNNNRTCESDSVLQESVWELGDHNYSLPSSKNLHQRNLYLTEKLHLANVKVNSVSSKLRKATLQVKKLRKVISSMLAKSQAPKSITTTTANRQDRLLQLLIKNHSKTDRHIRNYSEAERRFAITLNFYSAHAYRYLSKYVRLPHPRTVRRWASHVNGNPGITRESIIDIKKRVKAAKHPIYVTIIMDEMAIKQQLDFDGKRLIGYCNLGEEPLPKKSSGSLAKEALVFFCKALNGNWKYPIGYCLIAGLSGQVRANLLTQYIRELHDTGVHIVAVTCDGNRANMTMFKTFGVNFAPDNIECSFVNPADSSKRIRAILDPAHMVKLFRNLIGDFKVIVDGNGNRIQWKYFQRLNELQKTQGLRLANKLSDAHIRFHTQKMKVNLAVQTLSSSVAKALMYCKDNLDLPDFEQVDATVKFITIIDKVFDLLNSSNPLNKGLKSPISQYNISIIRATAAEAINYLMHLKTTEDMYLWESRRKTAVIGFIIDLRSFLSLADELVWADGAPLKYILGRNLSQDHLEQFFSCLRKRTGNNNNPTALEFRSAYRKCLLGRVEPNPLGNCDATDPDLNIGNVFLSPDKKYVVDDSNFIYLMSSEYTKDVVEYIAGACVKYVIPKISCDQCKALVINREEKRGLIAVKDVKNKLINPSQFIIQICETCETVIRSLPTLENNKNFMLKIFILVIKKLGIHFFKKYDHFFEDIDLHLALGQESHLNHLVKNICTYFITLRLRHQCKLTNERTRQQNLRRHYTKLILFKGQ